MATIQIRNVPDDVYRIYRARAAASGMSLQEYVLAELERNAATRTPSELVADVEARMLSEGRVGYAKVSAAAIVRNDRDGH